MIKKIFFILFIFLVVTSCGKKGDPKYKENQSKMININRIVLS